MKPTLLIATIFLVLFSNNSVLAIEADTVKSCTIPSEIKKALVKQISFPDEARKLNLEGKVAACFSITQHGKLQINGINGHPIFTNYVKNKMETFECNRPNANIVNRPMLIRFNFEIEHI